MRNGEHLALSDTHSRLNPYARSPPAAAASTAIAADAVDAAAAAAAATAALTAAGAMAEDDAPSHTLARFVARCACICEGKGW